MHWQNLIKCALLGTERHPPDGQTLAALEKLGIKTTGEPATLLAHAAAAFGQLRKAKIPVRQFEGECPAAPDEDNLPELSQTAARQLQLIFTGKYEDVLPEFLSLLRKTPRRIPARLLPQILANEAGQQHWSGIEPFIGRAGRWLLQQNPHWQHLALPPFAEGEKETDRLWNTGSHARRRALLLHLRRKNPDKARALLAQSWPDEKGADRAAFLEVFSEGLSLADEAFLEACLDDKREGVRQIAAGLLARLPTSALGQRMYRRAMACVSFDGRRLVVSVPAAIDDSARRDGIRRVAPEWPGGRKAAYLGQVVARVPPGHWPHHLGVEAGEVLALFLHSDWAKILAMALTRATVRFKDRLWAERLLMALPEHPHLPLRERGPEALAPLVGSDFLLRFANALFEQNRDFLSVTHQLMPLLRAVPGPWPEQLVHLLLQQFRQFVRSHKWRSLDDGHLPEMLWLMGCHAPLATAAVLLNEGEEPEAQTSGLDLAIAGMQEVLRFRMNLYRQLSQGSG